MPTSEKPVLMKASEMTPLPNYVLVEFHANFGEELLQVIVIRTSSATLDQLLLDRHALIPTEHGGIVFWEDEPVKRTLYLVKEDVFVAVGAKKK